MSPSIAAYQPGIYPRSEAVVRATRDLDRGRASPEDADQAFERDVDNFIGAQREARLDLYSDGLLRWQDIFRPLVEATEGMEARTLVRWFNNNSFFRAPAVTGVPHLAGVPRVFDDDARTPSPKVATLPSPYLFSRAAQGVGDRNGLMLQLAREVLRPVAEALVARGYGVIHLEEPWLVYFGIDPGDWGDLEKALEEIREGVRAPAKMVLHTYYGDAGPFATRLRALPVDALGIDFMETDLEALGGGWDVGMVVGCLNARNTPLESPEATAAFVMRVIETAEPPMVYVSANSGLELLPEEVARRKVARLGEVSERVRELVS